MCDSPKEIELSLSTNTNNHTYVGGQQRSKMGSYYFKIIQLVGLKDIKHEKFSPK